MNDEWPTLSLREVGVTLIDCVHRTPPAVDVGFPYVAIPQMVNGRLDLAAARKISAADLAEWTKKAAPKVDDVVLSRRCNPGETAYVAEGEHFALGQNLVLLRADGRGVFPPFLRWLVRGPEWWEQIGKYLNVGAVFDSLKCKDVPNFRLTFPPISTQQAIAETLGSLDDKIEQNRRTSRKLEELARGMFKAWFVDFEPAHAKAAGATSYPGMPSSVFDNLPTTFGESDFGSVPDGWRRVPLGQLVTLQRGKTYKSSLKGLPGPYLLGLGSIGRNGGFRDDSLKTYGGDSPENLLLRPGDLYVSLKDVTQSADLLGAVARVPLDFGIGRLTQDTVRLVPITSISSNSLYQQLLTPEYREYCRGCATGTTNLGLSREDFLAYPITLPDPRTANALESKLQSFTELTATLNSESRRLAELRDYLLPKLLSGQIRVKDAEKFVAKEGR